VILKQEKNTNHRKYEFMLKLQRIYTILLLSLLSSIGWSQNLNLRIDGDSLSGFKVDIYDGDVMLINNTEEFSLKVFNDIAIYHLVGN
jgi:hypothetical protein